MRRFIDALYAAHLEADHDLCLGAAGQIKTLDRCPRGQQGEIQL
jgi:hypothetical protein